MSRENESKPSGSSNPDAYKNAMIRGAVMAVTSAALAPVLGPLAPAAGVAAGLLVGKGEPDLGVEIG